MVTNLCTGIGVFEHFSSLFYSDSVRWISYSTFRCSNQLKFFALTSILFNQCDAEIITPEKKKIRHEERKKNF